jgi:hypothetical protein
MWRALGLTLLLSTACVQTARLVQGPSQASRHVGDERCE